MSSPFFSVIPSKLGSAKIARIAPNPKIDFPKSIIAIFVFRSQFFQSEQAEQYFFSILPTLNLVPLVSRSWGRQSEQLGLQYWTLDVKNCVKDGLFQVPLFAANPFRFGLPQMGV